MTSSRALFFACLSFIVGVGFASFFQVPFSFFYFLSLAFLLFSLFFFPQKFPLFLLLSLSFLLGVFRFQAFLIRISRNPLLSLFEKEIEIEGKVIDILKKEKNFQDLLVLTDFQKAKIIARTSRKDDFAIGRTFKFRGKLKKPQTKEDFDYQKSFLSKGIFGFLFFPKVEKPEQEKKSIFDFFLNLREISRKNVEKIFPPQYSFWVKAILLSLKEDFPKEEREKLQKTGLSHLIAISGLHFSILSFLIFNFLLFLGIKRKISIFLSLFFIFFYLFFLNFPVSATRATFMIFFIFLAQIFGRQAASLRVLVFAASFLLFFNPLLLRYDLSFQLSFLATFGLVYFYPSLLSFFERVPSFFKIKETLLATFSAQLFVLPLSLWRFGLFSPYFLWTNLILVPLFPLVLFSSFFVFFLSFFSLSLAQFFSSSVCLFLSLFQRVIDFFSKFPPLYLSFSPFWSFYSYLLLFSFSFFLRKKFDQPFFLG